MFTTAIAAFVLAASVNQVAATPSRARHMYAARAYAQDSQHLEDYDTYHTRYLAIGCIAAKKDNKDFFKSCCHPLTKNADASVLDGCTASTSSDPKTSSTSAAYSAAPTPETPTPSSGSSESYSGGYATFFDQNGVAGACGKVHSDSDYIVAADYRKYGNLSKQSDLCGKKVRITNTKNGKTVTCTVADACPTCENSNSLDLSRGAFNAIATEEEGMVPIDWSFI